MKDKKRDKEYRVKEIKEKFNWFKNKMENAEHTGQLDYIWHRDIKIDMHNVSKLYSQYGSYTKSEFDDEFARMKKDLKSFYTRQRQYLADHCKVGLNGIHQELMDSLYGARSVRVLDGIWHNTVKIELKALEEEYKHKKNLGKVKSIKKELTDFYKERRRYLIDKEKREKELKDKPKIKLHKPTTIYEAMKEGFYDEFMGHY